MELLREDVDGLVVGAHLLRGALLVHHVGVEVAVEAQQVAVPPVEPDDAVDEERHLRGGVHSPAAARGVGLLDLGVVFGPLPRPELDHEVGLGLEVAVERDDADARLGRDLRERHGLDRARGEEAEAGLQQPLPALGHLGRVLLPVAHPRQCGCSTIRFYHSLLRARKRETRNDAKVAKRWPGCGCLRSPRGCRRARPAHRLRAGGGVGEFSTEPPSAERRLAGA